MKKSNGSCRKFLSREPREIGLVGEGMDGWPFVAVCLQSKLERMGRLVTGDTC